MPRSSTAEADATSSFTAGQTWHSDFETWQVEVVTHNAAGDTVVGYVHETGTALATEAEFMEWVHEEGAAKA